MTWIRIWRTVITPTMTVLVSTVVGLLFAFGMKRMPEPLLFGCVTAAFPLGASLLFWAMDASPQVTECTAPELHARIRYWRTAAIVCASAMLCLAIVNYA
jgi:hypothetical protein